MVVMAHSLVEMIEETGAATKPDRTLVFVPVPIEGEDLRYIQRALPGVDVIIGESAKTIAVPNEIPHSVAHFDVAHWRWPCKKMEMVIVLGHEENVGLRFIVAAVRSGVKRFIFIEPSIVTIEPSIDRVRILSAPSLVWRHVVHRSLRPFRRALLWSIGQVQHAVATIWLRVQQFSPRFLTQPISAVGILAAELYGDQTLRRNLHESFRSAQFRSRDWETPDPSRVAFTIGTLGPGGSERQLVNLACELARTAPVKPLVACLKLSDAATSFYRHTLEKSGVEAVDVRVPGFVKWRDLALDEDGTSSVVRTLELMPTSIRQDVTSYLYLFLRERPGIVHSFLDDTNVKAGIAAVLAGVPRIILSARSVAPDNFALHRSYMRPVYRALLDQPQVIFCSNSVAGAEDYRRWLRRPQLPVEVIYNGIDLSVFRACADRGAALRQRLGLSSDCLAMGTVMRMTEEKQPLLWARIAVEISRHLPHVHFLIAGDGPLRSELEGIFAKAGIQKRIHILGHTPNVQEVFNALDLFLLTSRMEGLPNVLIEAQAIGVPVVTTPVGGAPEAVAPGVTGLVADGQSLEELTRACLRILSDTQLRRTYAENARRFVAEHFSLELMVKRTVELHGTARATSITHDAQAMPASSGLSKAGIASSPDLRDELSSASGSIPD
jgi:glycosyltransferase involved in cell wall biosynthesis